MVMVSVRGTERHLKRRNERRNGKKKKTTGKRKEDEARKREREKRKGERQKDGNLQNGDFFLDRPNQFRRGGSKEAPEVESDLEEGRYFHMGKVEKGENEV